MLITPDMLEPPKSSSDSDDGEDEDKRKRSHRHWAWTYSESPHKATPIHKHIHASLTTALPAQQLPSAYPAVQPYHPQSESSPLLYQTRVEGRRAKQVFLIVWDTAKDWLNPPLVGGMAAIIGGVVPFLHKAIFGESSPLKPYVNKTFGSRYRDGKEEVTTGDGEEHGLTYSESPRVSPTSATCTLSSRCLSSAPTSSPSGKLY